MIIDRVLEMLSRTKGYTTAGVSFRAAFLVLKTSERREKMVRINGEIKAAEGMLLKEYLEQEGYRMDRIAVECNGMIVPKAEYDRRVLQAGEVWEVVSFVGGG